ncbi:MAG TPA: tetratricopeptide repeat protein [Terriglobales bacterium]|nr:tetratricopeptide repeat protein [Terriglobales bacterium]
MPKANHCGQRQRKRPSNPSRPRRGGRATPPPYTWSPARHAATAVALALLATAGYANVLSNGFVWDDTIQILQNPGLRPGAPWLPLLTSDVWAFLHPGTLAKDNYYRPLQMLTYKGIVQLFGFSAPAFHTVNLAFHVAATLLAYAVLVHLTGRMALSGAAAAIFALHPMHTEAVAWISALPELGCAVFYFLAFLLFLLAIRRSRDEPTGEPARLFRRPALWLLSCASFAVATLWKEMAVTLPLVVAIYLFLFSGEELPAAFRIRRAVRGSSPYVAALAAYISLRIYALGYLSVSQRNWALKPTAYALTVFDLVGKYWWKLLLPVHLNAYHIFDPVRSPAEPRAIEAVLFLALAGAALFYGHRRFPLATFATSWVFVTLIPVLDLSAVGRNVFAERYLYIPSLGFSLLAALLAGSGLARLPAGVRSWLGPCALAFVLGLYFVQTVRRNPVWRDQYTFFSRTLAASPNSPVLANQVASLLYPARGDPRGAGRLYRRARALAEERDPPEPGQIAKADLGLALISSQRGSYDTALALVAAAQRAWPSDPQVPSVRGTVLLQAGRWQEARGEFETALRSSPNDANIWNGLGFIAWHEEHQYGHAASFFRHALQMGVPSQSLNASLQESLGAVYFEMGHHRRGLEHLQAATRIAPNDPDYHTNLASALASSGRLAQARAELEKALTLAPGNKRARAALSILANQQL